MVLPEPPAGRPLLLGIDGCSGSGKSTLARAIAAGLPDATVVPGDDFYAGEPAGWEGWGPAQAYDNFWDYDALERDVLLPLRRGANASYCPYDWDRNQPGTTAVSVLPSRVVIVEGVSMLRPQLRGYWDFAVYVDTPAAERHERILARGENDQLHIDKWNASEDYYCATHAPQAAADLVVNGSKSAGSPADVSFILPA